MNRLVVEQGRLVLPERVVKGDLVLEDGVIAEICPRATGLDGVPRIDARDKLVFPGAIDSQVHFREFTHHGDEDLHSGTLAAAAGGVTSVLEMPDSDPAEAHSVATLNHKLDRAANKCVVHYGFWLRATPDNLDELLTAQRAIGVRVALDCSGEAAAWVEPLFAQYPGILAVHAEDRARLASRYAMYEGEATVDLHPRIRDIACAVGGTERALALAARHGTRMHLLHVSSAEELERIAEVASPKTTAAVALPHLMLDDRAFATEGTRVQGNPPIRGIRHQDALWSGLKAGTATLVTSDHCPHTLEAKGRPYPQSASGMPGVEWLLPLMIDAALAGRCSLNDVARWTAEAPARTFGLTRKGRLEVGCDADIVLVDPEAERTLTDDGTRSAARWSPYRGRTVRGWPTTTLLLGQPVFTDGDVDPTPRGRALSP